MSLNYLTSQSYKKYTRGIQFICIAMLLLAVLSVVLVKGEGSYWENAFMNLGQMTLTTLICLGLWVRRF